MNAAGFSGLQVPIERLQRRDPQRRWTVAVSAESLASDGPMRVADVALSTGSPVALDLVLDRVSEGVEVTGEVTCRWTGPCSRCLEPIEGAITAVVEELFTSVPTEGETYLLDEDRVDLLPMVRDAILLELPVSAVPCPEGDRCPNLPPELVASLAAETDDAAPEEARGGDPRWAVLDRLRDEASPPGA